MFTSISRREFWLLSESQIPRLSHWVPIDSFRTNETMQGVDYHKLDIDSRSISLGSVRGSKNQVVSGVRFARGEEGTLMLQVMLTEFDFPIGKQRSLFYELLRKLESKIGKYSSTSISLSKLNWTQPRRQSSSWTSKKSQTIRSSNTSFGSANLSQGR